MSTERSAAQDAVIRMGRDIVRQFAHHEHDQAVEQVSAHLLKFWEPRMRAELRRCVTTREHDVDPVLVDAVRTWPDESATRADPREPPGG